MKITVLKNFGLNGESLEAGATLVVNKSHFGDNEQTFRDEGYFEDYVEPPKEEDSPQEPVRRGKKAIDPEPAQEPSGPDPA